MDIYTMCLHIYIYVLLQPSECAYFVCVSV